MNKGSKMKKVAYNSCFGGFSLSEEALRKLAELKDIDLTGAEFRYSSFFKDSKCIIDEPQDRSDDDLISVIELLGDKASGSCADLQIAEIPDGAEYEISEYDGNESVVPPRQSW